MGGIGAIDRLCFWERAAKALHLCAGWDGEFAFQCFIRVGESIPETVTDVSDIPVGW